MNYKFDPCFNLTIEEYFEEIIRLKKIARSTNVLSVY